MTPIDYAKHLRKKTFRRIEKFIMVNFWEMDFMKVFLH